MNETERLERRRVMARWRAVNSSFMGTSVGRPPAVAHGGDSSPWQRSRGCQEGAEWREGRQQSQRCAGGSPHKKINDVVAGIYQRCTYGLPLFMLLPRVTRMFSFITALSPSAFCPVGPGGSPP